MQSKLTLRLDEDNVPPADDLPPITRALRGVLAGHVGDEDDYAAFLEASLNHQIEGIFPRNRADIEAAHIPVDSPSKLRTILDS